MAANPQRWNRYAYVSGNPLRAIDPDGRDEFSIMQNLSGIKDNPTEDLRQAEFLATSALLVAGGAYAIARAPLIFGFLLDPRTSIAATKVAAALADQDFPTGKGVGLTLKLVEQDGDVIRLSGGTAKGAVEVVTNVAQKGSELILSGLHVDGPGKGSLGPKQLREVARSLGREAGATTVRIIGGTRTTGANPGRTPRQIVIRVNGQ